MKGLKIVLWICTVAFLCSFIAAVLPWPWIIAGAQWGGVIPPTTESTDVFIFRLSMATYGMIGIFFLLLARKPLAYGNMLLLAAYGLMALGVMILIGGMRYEMPLWAYGSKAVFIVLLGALIRVFRDKAVAAKK
jgi:hypothetical protein